LTGLVASKTREVAELNKDIDQLDANRNEEKEEFEEKVREHNEATQIITEARRLFEGLVNENSLLQKQQKTGTVALNKQALALIQKTLHDGAHKVRNFKHRSSYGSIFKILATITTNAQTLADGGHLQRL